MNLLQLGQRSRKTGLRPRDNLSKDKYDMEDIDEFFEDEENSNINKGELRALGSIKKNERSNKNMRGDPSIPIGDLAPHLEEDTMRPSLILRDNTNINKFARKINFDDNDVESLGLSCAGIRSNVDPKNDSPLMSPLHASKLQNIQQRGNRNSDDTDKIYNNVAYEDDVYYDDDIDMSLSPVVHSPIKLRDDTLSAGIQNEKGSLEKLNMNMNLQVEDEHLLEQSSNFRTPSKSCVKDPAILINNDNSYADSLHELISPPSSNEELKKKTEHPQKFIKSSLPSPPPEGLRRSKRTRIAPLAFWRNERIVYTRAIENVHDRECPLVNDIKKIPLQEIREVVRMPHLEKKKRSKSNHRQKSRVITSKTKQSPQVRIHQGLTDSKRSEWIKERLLALRVFEGANNNTIVRTVAWAPFEGSHRDSVNTDSEKLELVTLFSNDRGFTAGGIIELPTGGFKSQRNSLDSMYTFHVINGDIEINLNEDRFEVVGGCSFQIPCSNNFAFKNLASDISRLFFVQNKKIPTDSEEEW